MNSQHKTLVILLCVFLIATVSSLWGDEEINIDIDENEYDNVQKENFNATKNNGKFLKFSWEMGDYADKYEIARSYIWTEVSHGGEAFVYLARYRTENKGDSDEFSPSIAFRPLILDFDDFSIAVGASYAGSFSTAEERDSQDTLNPVSEDFDDGTFAGVLNISGLEAVSRNITAASNIQTAAFSGMASFPTMGIQISFDLGYAWSEFKGEVERIAVLNAPAALVLTSPFSVTFPTTYSQVYQKYLYHQKREGIFFHFEVRKFFIRNYLNFFSISLNTIYNLYTTKRTSRVRNASVQLGNAVAGDTEVNLPSELILKLFSADAPFPLDDVQESKYFDSNLTTVDLTVRVYSLPFETGVIGKQALSIEVVGGVGHTTGELWGGDFHGISYSLGGQLSIFDVIYFGYTYTWENNNDQDDTGVVFLGVGLYG